MRSRRFDPYGGGDGGAANAPTSSNTNNALPHGTARQRTLVGNSNNGSSNNNVRTTSHNNSAAYTPQVGSNNNISPAARPMQPTRSSGNLMRSGSDHGNGIMSHRVHSSTQQQAYPQNQQSYSGHNTPNAYVDRGNGYNMNGGQYNNNNNHTTNDIVMGKTGAAPLATQVHPLMEVRKRSGAQANQQQGGAYNPYAGNDNKQRGQHSRSRHHHSPYQQSSSNFLSQSKRIISLLLGQVSEDDMNMLQKQQQYDDL